MKIVLVCGLVVVSLIFPVVIYAGDAPALTDEKISQLEAQIKNLQRQVDELKSQRQADRQEISNLKTAQETTGLESALPPGTDIMVTGYMDLEYTDSENSSRTFDNHHFNPIFIGMLGDNLFFEAELEYEHSGYEKALEVAAMHYFLNDYITLGAGKFLVPFGIYNERLHPTWIAKLPVRPLYANQVIPVSWSEAGVDARGAVSLSKAFNLSNPLDLEYNLYMVNGLEGAEGAAMKDLRDNITDNNDNIAVGGRIGLRLLPWAEVGGSFYNGAYTADGNKDITIGGADVTLHWDLFKLRGEFARVEQEITHYTGRDLIKEGYYVEGSYFLSALPVPHLSKCELVARYTASKLDTFTSSTTALGVDDDHRYSLGLNYYIKDSFIFRLAYDWNKEDKTTETDNDQLGLQLSLGF